MAEITLGVKTFEFGDRHGAHLGMKVTAIFAKITTQIASSAMFHQFCTPFWMHKVAALTTNSMFTIIVLVMATHFNRFGSISSYAGIRFGFIVVVVVVVVVLLLLLLLGEILMKSYSFDLDNLFSLMILLLARVRNKNIKSVSGNKVILLLLIQAEKIITVKSNWSSIKAHSCQ